MGHEFVDQMMEKPKAGELRSRVRETLDKATMSAAPEGFEEGAS